MYPSIEQPFRTPMKRRKSGLWTPARDGSVECAPAGISTQIITKRGWFLPSQITGLSLWFSADFGTSTTTNGATISQWDNRSLLAGTTNAVQATEAKKPTYVSSAQNSKPGVAFDNSDDFMSGTMTAFTACTFITAAKFNTAAGQNCILEMQPNPLDSNAGVTLFDHTNTLRTRRIASDATKAEVTGSFKVFSGDADTSLGRVWIDQALGTDSTTTVTLGSLDCFTLGMAGGGVLYPLDGTILEVCAYNSVLSDANRQAVESYMKTKYAI